MEARRASGMVVSVAGRWSVVLASAALTVTACGQRERVSPDVARQLPTHKYALSQDICPEQSGAPPEYSAKRLRRIRRRGERQLAALERAYRHNPDALVRVSYAPADEPGIGHEEISVRELAKSHLEGLEDAGGCYERAAKRLRALLQP